MNEIVGALPLSSHAADALVDSRAVAVSRLSCSTGVVDTRPYR